MAWIIPFAQLSLIVWQVYRGVVIGHDWKPWYTRVEQPKQFWGIIAIQCAMVAALVVASLTLK